MEIIRNISIKLWGERHKILRYLFSGGTAAVVNFFFLYAFTEWIHFYYMVSVVLAFLIAVIVSFLLQKFWTFKDSDKLYSHKQAIIYFVVAVCNTVINAGLVYFFVEFSNFHYMLGQFLASGIIAFESFFVYQYFIFKKQDKENIEVSI
jgi:putative flippase GtrA